MEFRSRPGIVGHFLVNNYINPSATARVFGFLCACAFRGAYYIYFDIAAASSQFLLAGIVYTVPRL